jgi:hypothetical protein
MLRISRLGGAGQEARRLGWRLLRRRLTWDVSKQGQSGRIFESQTHGTVADRLNESLRLEGVRTSAPVEDELNDVQVMDQALALLTTLNLQLDTVSTSRSVNGSV